MSRPRLTFHYFHLMPWPDLPPDFDEKYDSAWVTLPNSIYDPEKGHALYNRYFDELERADKLGWDSVCVNEHHQNAYGTMPSPNIMAAVLTQRIKRARIGIIGNALPLHDDPLRVAEEIAMLDVISGGRIISGFVRGTGMEYFSYNINPTLSRERMNEAHDLIIQAWTRPGPFSFEGEHYNYRYVNIWPRPLQKPHPPIWMPGTASLETIDFAAAHRYPYMTVFMPMEQRKRAYELYRRLAEEKYGYEAQPEQLAFCVPIAIAETDDLAMKEGERYMMWLFQKAMKVPTEFFMPPGYMSLRSIRAAIENRASFGFGDTTFRELVEQGVVIAGSPATVIEKLSYYTEVLHAGMLVTGGCTDGMPDYLVLKHQEMMAKEVMPYFRQQEPPPAPRPAEIHSEQA
ncbi:LLM class flavin-dependent oxidoreductase [Thermogemmatispora onikobensis]|uniref:LLM class flavin-dependent oxidoreductase n=1 Tax=Thermogemmatispora onikobensis TaxID=732234 RepID=UPI000852C8BA|nr:LLM class flavin-dependent oxidoreductase [Thermogemmatispora onikobensis]